MLAQRVPLIFMALHRKGDAAGNAVAFVRTPFGVDVSQAGRLDGQPMQFRFSPKRRIRKLIPWHRSLQCLISFGSVDIVLQCNYLPTGIMRLAASQIGIEISGYGR